MCGFIGYIGKDKKDLRECAKIISHRGPDKTSIEQNENFSVAFNRLSIIDISDNGMQPFKLSDVVVYFNGEIYNYLELQKKFQNEFFPKGKSDGEILPFLYKKFGINFLNGINGMFSMVIIDQKLKKAFFIRDRFAEKPLFYKVCNSTFYFSSEIKALVPLLNLEENKDNLAINFSCLFMPQGHSLFKDVFAVNPGSYIELDYSKNFKFKEIRWYHPKFELNKFSKKNIFEELDSRLNESLKIRTRSDVPVGVFLSGGLDSTCITKYAVSNTIKKLTSFTSVPEGKYQIEENLTDIEIPKKFSSLFGITNHQVNLDFKYFDENILNIVLNCEELFLDSGNMMKYALAKKAKEKGIKVILSGTGGDELFGGYPWQKQVRFFPYSLLSQSFNINKSFHEFFSRKIIFNNRKIFKFFQILLAPKIWHAETLADGIFFRFFKNKQKYLSDINKISNKIYNENSKYLSNDIENNINYLNIFYPLGAGMYSFDMSAMSNSIENRSPLLDHHLWELMQSFSNSYKNLDGQKSLFRKFLEWKRLPDYVTQAKKSGPTMNTYKWMTKLNEKNKLKKFFKKNINILEYVFDDSVDYNLLVDSNIPKNSFITFGFLNLILWFKAHIEKKASFKNQKLSEIILDI